MLLTLLLVPTQFIDLKERYVLRFGAWIWNSSEVLLMMKVSTFKSTSNPAMED